MYLLRRSTPLVYHLFKHVDHVEELAVNVSNNDNRLLHLQHVGLRLYQQQIIRP